MNGNFFLNQLIKKILF